MKKIKSFITFPAIVYQFQAAAKCVKAKLTSMLCLVSGTYKIMFNKIDYRKPESCFLRDPKKEGIPITKGLY
jgi:hypothetical protein